MRRPSLPVAAVRADLRRLGAFLSWRRPPLWALVYLALIPGFATAFWFLPAASFHDSNSVREAGAFTDAVRLRAALTRSIVDHLRGRTWTYHGERLQLSPQTIDVYALEYTTDGRLLIEVGGDFAPIRRSRLAFGHFALAVEPSLREGPLISGHPGGLTYAVSVTQTVPAPRPAPAFARPDQPPVSLLFAPPGVALPVTSASEAGTLVMAPAIYGRLLAYYLSLGGDPHYASDLWWRMLYLSAVTITTLGFGDITPISGTARALVGSEAVLGVIVIGIFLGTLALYARRPREIDPTP